ncbi:hypothetical protein HanRHA438_Chr00c06g0846231 [Helianthus annuus]|nr:hypothetical protein HanRHA438_Chr00c06g0846231 [Helianthus annuus]
MSEMDLFYTQNGCSKRGVKRYQDLSKDESNPPRRVCLSHENSIFSFLTRATLHRLRSF